MTDPAMQVEVHTAPGGVLSFVQLDEGDARHTFTVLSPQRVFEDPTFVLSRERSMTTFRTEAIRRLRFESRVGRPDWGYGSAVDEARLVDEESFDRLVESIERSSGSSSMLEAGSSLRGAVRLVDTAGETLWMEVAVTILPDVIRAGRTERILEGPVIHCRDGDRGDVLINPRHVVSVETFPATPELPLRALQVR